jgi:hypothetical protein
MPLDPRTAKPSRAALVAFNADVFPILAQSFSTFNPDPEERRRFTERAVEEYTSGTYHVSLKMYFVIGLG